MPKKLPISVRVQVTMSPAVLAKVDAYATREAVTRSRWLRRAAENYIATIEGEVTEERPRLNQEDLEYLIALLAKMRTLPCLALGCCNNRDQPNET